MLFILEILDVTGGLLLMLWKLQLTKIYIEHLLFIKFYIALLCHKQKSIFTNIILEINRK